MCVAIVVYESITCIYESTTCMKNIYSRFNTLSRFLSRGCLLLGIGLWAATATAGVTTYTFTSAQWASKQGTTACDGTTDGWHCDKAGESISTSYQIGVRITKNYSGAGATSVLTFHHVQRLTFNYATTTKGVGNLRVQIGENAPIDTALALANPNNANCTLVLPEEQTGQIQFAVNCSTNSIYLNSVTIYSEDGAAPDFTQTTYRLVTDLSQLEDSDQVMIGVADGSTRKVLGYYDETVSKNNIHAITGAYSADGSTVEPDEAAIYTLRKVADTDGTACFVLQDELRYEEAYLVANGGKTKNRLAAWNAYTSPTYGAFGLWTISVGPSGEATIVNRGTSLANTLLYNATDDIFSCYAQAAKYTPVALYRATPAPHSDQPVILAPLVSFPDVCLSTATITGSKTVRVNAANLSGDILVSLKHGAPFSLSASSLSRYGDDITVSYSTTEAGQYIDTIVLASPDTTVFAPVLLRVSPLLTIAEAVLQEDFAVTCLDEVVVTKKYDRYIFVRDETGSMLLYDTGTADGKRYGSGLENGHVLRGVRGRFQNYYGVPELLPMEAWTAAAHKTECLPDSGLLALDSTDVCRYVRIDSAEINGDICTWRGVSYAIENRFNIGSIVELKPTQLTAVVYYDHDVVTLWPVAQTLYPESTAIRTAEAENTAQPYTLLGVPVHSKQTGIIVQKGKKYLRK